MIFSAWVADDGVAVVASTRLAIPTVTSGRANRCYHRTPDEKNKKRRSGPLETSKTFSA